MTVAMSVVVALWGAVSVFVLWVALTSVLRRRWAQRSRSAAPSGQSVPDPWAEATPEEILEAQSIGLLPAEYSRTAGGAPPQTR